MSFTLYKTTPIKLSYNSVYSHYIIGTAATDVKYIYVDQDPTVHFMYNVDDNESSPDTSLSFASAPTVNLYTSSSLTNANDMYSLAFVNTSNTISTTDNTVDFYVIDSDAASTVSLTAASLDAPTGLVIQETYPHNKGYSLMNGSFVTYTPNKKRRIVVSFDYLPETTLAKFVIIAKTPVVIVPEDGETDVSPFESKSYVCNWEGNELNFQYSTKYKKAGYKGSIAFREV
jgi:hypothetical protein